MRRGAAAGGAGGRAVTIRRWWRRSALSVLSFTLFVCALRARPLAAQDDAPRRLDAGRFTAVYFPQDDRLARTLLDGAVRTDSFAGLPRPRQRVLIAIAPDAQRFRAWVGPRAPEWGVAVAFPESRRVVMQGRTAGSDAGDPAETLRHELAHLALHEFLGDRPPRWFDEGYASLAAREWRREDVLAANVALALRGTPSLDELEASFERGTSGIPAAYALSYRAVTELAALDRERGLGLLFRYWIGGRTLDQAMRQAYGVTLAGFERTFQERTRRRYGALALVADLSLVFLAISVVLLPLFVSRRVRDRRRLRAMLAAEADAERAERVSALAVLMEQGDEADRRDPAEGGDPSPQGPTSAGDRP